MKIQLKNINEFNDGEEVNGFYLCISIENKTTRLGDEYLDLVLQDCTGRIRAKVWSFADTLKKRIKSNYPLAVKGKVITYNDNLELDILSANLADKNIYGKYGYNEKNLIRGVDEDSTQMYKELFSYVNSLSNDYKKIITKIIKDNAKIVKSIPSIDESYNLHGGFLQQIICVLRLNKQVISIYKNLDKDLVKAGIMIRNIGLIHYFNDDLTYSINDVNENLGSRLLGINIINDYCTQYVKFPQNIKTNLQNIILSENSRNDININYINSLYAFNLSIHSSMNKEEK